MASAPCPTEPRMHSYLKPLWGHPFPHIIAQSLKKKKKEKKKSTSPFPGVKENVYLEVRWLSGLCCITGPSLLAPHQGWVSWSLQK